MDCCLGNTVTSLRNVAGQTLAMPYPAIVGVPEVAGAAPVRTISPPGLRWEVASEAEMEAGHTEDLHMA